MSVAVTGSLVAALALSYAVFPGSVLPAPAQRAATGAVVATPAAAEVAVPAAEIGNPLRLPTGSVARTAVHGKERRPLVRAEVAARGELADAPGPPRGKKQPVDEVTAAYVTAGVSLVRTSLSESGKPGSTRSRATVAGRTVDVAVGSTTEEERVRTVAMVESDRARGEVTLRSTETLDGLPCPDTDGQVEIDVRVEVEVAGDPGEDGVTSVAAAAVRAEVDDQAELTAAAAALTASTTAGSGADVEGVVELDGSGSLAAVVAEDLPVDGAERARAEEGLAAARALAVGALAAARERWAGGGCLSVTAELPDEVEQGSTTPFTPEVSSLLDTSPVDAEVSVEVDGPGQVQEQGPGFVFVAGPEPGRDTVLRIRAVSRRGIAETRLRVATPSPDLRVTGEYKSAVVQGVKCAGPTGRWELQLVGSAGSSAGELAFRLDESMVGSYSGSRTFGSLAGTITVSEGGVAQYRPAAGRLLLADREGGQAQLAVEQGAFC